MSEDKLSHVDKHGNATMVDVSAKTVTIRTATVRSVVYLAEHSLEQLRDNTSKKGDVLAVARIAGITAAKKTGDLIPLCHPLGLDHVAVQFHVGQTFVAIQASAKTTGKTGVEMEALVAASIAAATIYDMVKGIDRTAYVGATYLHHKSGGKSGTFERQDAPIDLENAVWQ